MITMDLYSGRKTKSGYVALKWKARPRNLRVVVEDTGPELGFQKIALLKRHHAILFGAKLILN